MGAPPRLDKLDVAPKFIGKLRPGMPPWLELPPVLLLSDMAVRDMDGIGAVVGYYPL